MLKGMGGYLTAFDFGAANPAQQAFTDYALSEIGITDPAMIWHGTKVKNIFNGDIWVLNNTPDTAPPIFEWVNDGPEIISSDLSAVNAEMVEGLGRNLLEVLGVSTIAEAMAEIRRRCNNNGEIDASKAPQFGDIMIGDYLDGIDLSGLTPTVGGTAPQAWNETYKNNRVVVAGLNTYKGMGANFENDKNHILFAFRNCIGRAKMNQTNTSGGYPQSEMRTWLEGVDGDGSGVVAAKLKQELGGEYLYKINKLLPTGGANSDWTDRSLFIPTALEIFGIPLSGTEGVYDPMGTDRTAYCTPIQIPLYQKSYDYRIKRWTGARDRYFEATPSASSSFSFCYVGNTGYSRDISAGSVGGVAPAFCVA
jgi:hypothetical protein